MVQYFNDWNYSGCGSRNWNFVSGDTKVSVHIKALYCRSDICTDIVIRSAGRIPVDTGLYGSDTEPSGVGNGNRQSET